MSETNLNKLELPSTSTKSLEFSDTYTINTHYQAPKWILLGFAALYLILISTETKLFSLFGITSPESFSIASLLFTGLLLFPAFILTKRALYFKKHPEQTITITKDKIHTPRRVGTKKYLDINLKDIRAVDTRGKDSHAFHVIQTQKETVCYPKKFFNNTKSWKKIPEIILQNIAQLESGTTKLAQIRAQAKLSKKIFNTKAPATLSLGILTLITYLIFSGKDLLFSFSMAGIGANSSQLVLEHGEYFRLITSGFIHAGYLHLFLNLAALFTLGYLVEGLLGSGAILAIFFSSLLAGSFGSALNEITLSVGASAGVFGLLGSFLILNIKYHKLLPAGLSMSYRWWIIILGFNFLLPVLIPRIDSIAHIAGFFGGIILTFLLTKKLKLAPYQGKAMWGNYLGCTLTTLAVLAGLQAYFKLSNLENKERANQVIIQEFLDQPGITSRELNQFAWEVAITDSTPTSMLALAEQASLRSLKEEPYLYLLDTLATIWYRQGKFEKAILLEEIALGNAESKGEREFYSSQLLKFRTQQ